MTDPNRRGRMPSPGSSRRSILLSTSPQPFTRTSSSCPRSSPLWSPLYLLLPVSFFITGQVMRTVSFLPRRTRLQLLSPSSHYRKKLLPRRWVVSAPPPPPARVGQLPRLCTIGPILSLSRPLLAVSALRPSVSVLTPLGLLSSSRTRCAFLQSSTLCQGQLLSVLVEARKMGMQDREWYREHHRNQQQSSNRQAFSRPAVVIRSRFAPGFFLGLVAGAVAISTYFVFMPDAFRALYIRVWTFLG